jgi:hypothetical protein
MSAMSTTDFTAIAAIVISLANVAFIVRGRRDARVNFSVDLSIKNLVGEIADLRNSLEPSVKDGGVVKQCVANKVNAYFYYLDYVAKLINTGKVDRSYLSPPSCHSSVTIINTLSCILRSHTHQTSCRVPNKLKIW